MMKMDRPTLFHWLILAVGLAAAPPSLADSPSATETFDAPLAPNRWQLEAGDAAGVGVGEGRLILAPQPREALAIRYRTYPLRGGSSRPALGNFAAVATVVDDSEASPLRFGLWDDRGEGPAIVLEMQRRRARIEALGSGRIGPWRSIGGTSGEDSMLQLTLRRSGRQVDAFVEGAGSITPIGRWSGELAPIVDAGLEVLPTAAGGAVQVDALRLDALPPAIGVRLQPRDGVGLPGDNALPVAEPTKLGGPYLGGFLWPRDAEAYLEFELVNPGRDRLEVTVEVRVTDWRDEEVAKSSVRVEAEPGLGLVTLPLPTARYGAFTAHLEFRSADHEPLAAPLSVGFGVTAAPLPHELSDRHSVGVHSLPFARVGAKWTRFHDNGGRAVTWSGIQREPDRWNWDGMDAYVARCEAAGVRPLAVLAMTPEWASSDPNEPKTWTYRGRGAYSPPQDLEHWREYCRRVAERYKGRIRHYEIWNEPNNNELSDRGFFFHAPVEKYFEMAEIAHDAIKAVDPQALVLAPSGTGNFFPFLERFMELGGGDTFDILSIHTYTTPFPPEIGYAFNNEKSYGSRVERARQTLARHGHGDKPIWNTEIGYQSGKHLPIAGVQIRQDQIAAEALPGHWPNWKSRWSFRPVDPRRTAAFFTRFLILSPVYGVEKTFIHHRLMVSNDGDTSPYLAAPAVGFFSKLLGEADFVRSLAWHDAVQAQVFRTGDGRHVVAVWRVDDESLTMGQRDERALSDVETAPVTGIAGIEEQTPLQPVEGEAPRETYFPPGRRVPRWVEVSETPSAAFDMWGNALPVEGRLRVNEAPLYLVYGSEPVGLSGVIHEGVPDEENAMPAMLSEAGDLEPLSPDEAASKSPSRPSLSQWLDGPLQRLPNRAAERPEGSPHSELRLDSGQEAVWTLPQRAAGEWRVVLLARSRGGPGGRGWDYGLDVAGEPVNLRPLAGWPERVRRQGGNWVEIEGGFVSDPITLETDDLVAITSRQADGRVYEVWLWPTTERESEP